MMITLITAALVAAQPAPPASAHAQMPMPAEQHDAMKEKCCCDDMAKHEGHEPGTKPQDHHGE